MPHAMRRFSMHAFLVGGGRDAAGCAAAHRPFVDAARARHGDAPLAILILDEGEDTDVERWTATLAAAGAPATRPVVVSTARPPAAEDVAGAGGIYVAGGLTPGYQEALAAAGTGWLDAAAEAGAVYGGFSAGAAVAARRALVGGWRAEVDGSVVAVCDDGAGEDLDLVTVRDGLGIAGFTIDVHCAQWGTLTRLVHAVREESADEGMGIDEHTTLELDGATLRVHGLGAVYRVRAGEGVDVLGPGAVAELHSK